MSIIQTERSDTVAHAFPFVFSCTQHETSRVFLSSFGSFLWSRWGSIYNSYTACRWNRIITIFEVTQCSSMRIVAEEKSRPRLTIYHGQFEVQFSSGQCQLFVCVWLACFVLSPPVYFAFVCGFATLVQIKFGDTEDMWKNVSIYLMLLSHNSAGVLSIFTFSSPSHSQDKWRPVPLRVT